jgi:tetratricopeptide (TPR) repeat protein
MTSGSPKRSRFRLLPLLLAVTGPGTIFAQHSASADPDALIADGHYLRAQAALQPALQRTPNDAHTLVQKSILEWAFFHVDSAIATAEKAVAAADKSAEARIQLTNSLGAKLIINNTGTFERMNLARRFRKEADRSLELDPQNLDALEASARFYWEAPGMLGGDKAKALQLSDRIANLDPARGAAIKAGFLVEKDKAKRDAAVEVLWKAAVAAAPNSADAHAGLSEAYFKEGTGNLSLAETEARRALTLKPSRITAYRQLAEIYARTARWDDLDKLLKQAHTAVPDDLSPDYQAARIILVSDAKAQFAHAEQYLHAYLGQPAEGQEPPLAAAHWRLGLILEKQGHHAEAIKELQTAISMDSSLEGAKKDLERLS